MSVPQLRFKEFSGDWKSLHLGNITTTLTSGSRDWAQHYSNAGSKFIRMTNLSRDGIHLKLDDLKFVNIESDSADGRRTSLVHGDILISITAELGKIGWVPPNFGEAFINQHTALVRLDNKKADSRCVAYLLSTPKVNKVINRMNDAGAKAGLNLPTIKSICINLPEKEEQTKIATFLTAADEKIAQFTRKCVLLAQYKKGAMQQIFSQALRFKDEDGRDFPEWEEKNLGELLTHKSTRNKDEQVGLVLSVSNKKGFVTQEEQFDGHSIASKDLSNYKIVSKDDFGYNPSRINVGSIARLKLFDAGIVSPMYVVFRTKKGLDNVFFENMYNTHYFKHMVKIGCSGSVRDSLNFDDMALFKIKLPRLKEQTKIANFLTTIDDKITHAQAQLAAAKQYKQGLLQQMFV